MFLCYSLLWWNLVKQLVPSRNMSPLSFVAGLLLVVSGLCSPIEPPRKRSTTLNPAVAINFPDPSVLQDTDGTWYTFATNGNGKNVQVASAPAVAGPWTVLDIDLLPRVGSWSNGANVWAPDVRKVGNKYILQYSATDANQTAQHCVGAASADTILGPYTPNGDDPFACPLDLGGAIDSMGFTDTDGTHYVVYKVDGNSEGKDTPLLLQQVQADGMTPTADEPTQLLDRGPADGPLIEAPDLVLVNGIYFLFFSSNLYNTALYDISYATSSSLKGPYRKSSAPLAVTNNPFNLTAPGGATATSDGKTLFFHANCGAGRCMFEASIDVSNTTVTFAS